MNKIPETTADIPVWMAAARTGLDAHRLVFAAGGIATGTVCGRSIRTGIQRSAGYVKDFFAPGWCRTCFPGGSPLDQAPAEDPGPLADVPLGPIKTPPDGRPRGLSEDIARLSHALRGLQLGTEDLQMIGWAARILDAPTKLVLLSWLERARDAGRAKVPPAAAGGGRRVVATVTWEGPGCGWILRRDRAGDIRVCGDREQVVAMRATQSWLERAGIEHEYVEAGDDDALIIVYGPDGAS